jgi:hypothetical protein
MFWMTTMSASENLAEIVAAALDRCVPGSIGFQNLTGCHRDRLLFRATAAIKAVREAGYVIAPREEMLHGGDSNRPEPPN